MLVMLVILDMLVPAIGITTLPRAGMKHELGIFLNPEHHDPRHHIPKRMQSIISLPLVGHVLGRLLLLLLCPLTRGWGEMHKTQCRRKQLPPYHTLRSAQPFLWRASRTVHAHNQAADPAATEVNHRTEAQTYCAFTLQRNQNESRGGDRQSQQRFCQPKSVIATRGGKSPLSSPGPRIVPPSRPKVQRQAPSSSAFQVRERSPVSLGNSRSAESPDHRLNHVGYANQGHHPSKTMAEMTMYRSLRKNKTRELRNPRILRR
eukprot:gene11335-biopygen6269